MVAYATSPQRRFAQQSRRLLAAARRDGKAGQFFEDFQEGLVKQQIPADRISLRSLFTELVKDGYELVETFKPTHQGTQLAESVDVVDSSDFSHITGQIVFSRVLQGFRDPAFICDQLFETIPTQFSGEKIAGIGRLGDMAESIAEGEPFPLAGLSQEWIETPETTKRGMIVPVTKEAIFFDRTGMLLQHASEVGRWLGVNKEKRCLDVALGIATTYNRNGGGAQATYGDTHTGADFDNLVANNALVDWTSIEAAQLAFDAITDPNTGEPISVSPNTIIAPTALKLTARRIVNATEIEFGPGGSTSDATTARSANPLAGESYPVVSSQYVKQRTGSDTTWFIGEPKKAFKYMENWPITTVQAPANSHDEFHRDIVVQYKTSERGAPAVLDPRYMVKCTG